MMYLALRKKALECLEITSKNSSVLRLLPPLLKYPQLNHPPPPTPQKNLSENYQKY